MEMYMIIAVIIVVAAINIYKRRKKGAEKVPQGMQVYDENGNVVFDINDYAFDLYGIVTTTAKVAGSVTDSRINKDTCLFMIISAKHPNFDYAHMTAEQYYNEQQFSQLPNFTIANGRISWDATYRSSSSINVSGYNVTFAYGGPST